MGEKGGKLGLHPNTAVGAGLRAFAGDILREARAAIDNPAATDATAVHDFRRAMKRWRALLRLLEPIVGSDARRVRDEARDLARELAAARDTQAALNAIDDIAKADSSFSARSLRTIRERLNKERVTAEAGALTPATREKMRAMLDAAAKALEGWPLDEAAFRQAADALSTGYVRIRSAMPADWSAASDEELHELRQRIVVHRYQMPLVAPLWPRFSRLLGGELQRLRERLGAHQDLTVLAAMTAPRQPLAPWRTRLADLIVARKAAHVIVAQRIAGRLFAERPKAFRRRIEALWESARQTAEEE